MKSAYATLAIALLLVALSACTNARPNDGTSAPPPLSPADQDFIASRHGGM